MARKNSSISRRRLLTGFGAQAALGSVSVNSSAQTKGHSPMADDRLGKRMVDLPCISGERFLFLLPPHTSVRTLRG
jgi:hypothetical protein